MADRPSRKSHEPTIRPVAKVVVASDQAINVRLDTLEPGARFTRDGQNYRLAGLTPEFAQVIRLAEATITIEPGKTKTIFNGVERLEMPLDSEVVKE